MRTALAGLLVLAVITGAVQPAVAASPTAKLRHKVSVLKQRNTNLRSNLRLANGTIVTLTQQRDAARAQALARTGAQPSPSSLDIAVEQVRREVTFAENYIPNDRSMLIAHAAMTYVNGHVSAPAYGFGVHPEATAESVLRYGAGICGHAALTFATIVKRFDMPVRSVQFYYADGASNHIAAEVFYDGSWHYFDPTYGAYYVAGGRVLSIAEARAHPDPRSMLEQNGTLFWRVVQRRFIGSELGAETDLGTRVEIDKQPF